MTQDDRMETITDPEQIRATDEPDERGDFPCCTTPAPVGAAVALDLDRIADGARMGFKATPDLTAALVAEVRRLAEENASYADELLTCDREEWRVRAESAEAEVVTLRARLAAVEAVERGLSEGWVMLATVSDRAEFVRDLRAALAVTTGEGQ
jgi:hypothetical protein